MNHRKQSRLQLWPGFSCSLCWWCSQWVRLSAGSLYTKKILQMYSMLSNPLSKLKGSPSAVLRFLRGSSLTRFLSLAASLFLLFPLVKLTFITGLWQWQRLSWPGSGPAVRFTVGLFFYWCCVRECPADSLAAVTRHPSFTRNRTETIKEVVYWSQHENIFVIMFN